MVGAMLILVVLICFCFLGLGVFGGLVFVVFGIWVFEFVGLGCLISCEVSFFLVVGCMVWLR